MLWIAPSEINPASAALEKRLGDAADQFRTCSGLKSQENSREASLRISRPELHTAHCWN